MIDRKQLYISENGSFNIFLVESDEDLPLHEHDTKEIIIILEGKGVLEFGEGKEKKEFDDKSVLTVEPQIKHKLICKTKTKGLAIYIK